MRRLNESQSILFWNCEFLSRTKQGWARPTQNTRGPPRRPARGAGSVHCLTFSLQRSPRSGGGLGGSPGRGGPCPAPRGSRGPSRALPPPRPRPCPYWAAPLPPPRLIGCGGAGGGAERGAWPACARCRCGRSAQRRAGLRCRAPPPPRLPKHDTPRRRRSPALIEAAGMGRSA